MGLRSDKITLIEILRLIIKEVRSAPYPVLAPGARTLEKLIMAAFA